MSLTTSPNQTWSFLQVFARLFLCWLLTLSGRAGISETEPNDSQTSANTLTFDANFRCSVSEAKVYPRTDLDFFKVTVPQFPGPLSLRITMTPTASDQALDAWFRVLSPSGIELLSQDKASDNMSETYDLSVEGGSTYFIQCKSADLWSSGLGNYRLTVDLFELSTIQSAYWVTPNQTLTVFDGTPIQLKAKVTGFEVGDNVTFRIYEDDVFFDDFITSLTGKVVLVGTEKYVSATWNSQWVSDGSDGPEFYFTVSGRDLSATSNFLLNVIPADSDDSIAESISFGPISTSREGNSTIEISDDVDIYSFQVVAGQKITFDIDRPSGSLTPLLRLFNSNGVELNKNAGGVGPLESPANEAFIQYTFATTGTYYIGVSGVGNANYDARTGANDGNGSTGAYRLTLSSGLVGHVRKQDGSTEYLVDFLRMDKPGQPIDNLKTTWIIIHGWNDSRLADSMKELSNALIQSRPMDQVLTLDWSSIADSGLLDPWSAAAGIVPVGFWAAETLKQAGFSGNKINIIGHSFGCYVGDEIAKFFPGKINSIVALDPAANGVKSVFDPVANNEINFARDSEWSWAFHSSSFGNEYTPVTANEAFIFDSGLGMRPAHSAPIYLFSYMLLHPLETFSKLFGIDSLLDMAYGPWSLNQYYSNFFFDDYVLGYEAIISGFSDGTPIHVSYVTNAPFLRINTPSTSGVVKYSPVLITGSATDAGRGSNGIASVFVNGKRASGDTAVSGGQANWSALTELKLGTNRVTVVATDGSQVNIGVTTNTLALIYSPEAVSLPDLVVDEQSILSTDVSTKDAELSALPLAHTLVVGPIGMTVSRSGSLSWQPTEAQGPSTNLVEIIVTDGAASTRKRFSVIVREVNTAPSLTLPPVQVVAEGAALDLLLIAADPDIPAQPLRFSLIAGPTGLAITPSGRVNWSPTQAQRSSTNLVVLSVTDGITTISGEFRVALPATNPPAEQPSIAIRNSEQPGILELQISGAAGIELILETSDSLGSWVEEKRIIGQGMNLPVRVPLPTIPGTAERFWRAKNTGR